MVPRLAALLVAVATLAPVAAPLAAAESSANAPRPEPMPPPIADRGPPARAAVLAALTARRAHNVQSFHAYNVGGVYPHNTVRPGPLNVWRDAAGHLCAAATMLETDGQHDLVVATAKDHNQIRLLDVTEGPLMSWILTSGLTLEEIDRIQAPPVMPDPGEYDRAQATAREDAKLHKGYDATERYLRDHAKAGLAVATDRLMAEPEIAWALVNAAASPASSAGT